MWSSHVVTDLFERASAAGERASELRRTAREMTWRRQGPIAADAPRRRLGDECDGLQDERIEDAGLAVR
jgi:hypothetical protein